ncbi:MAG: EamA family transporter [Spirochaetia bacterium]|jgi:drug/metabolite transporter (DMT)-like permease|nr:EamA family transporter [Spirochaetia bacterium]
MSKYLFAILATVINAGAQILLKKASLFSHRDNFFYLYVFYAGLLYIVSFVLYAIALKYFPITKLSPITMLGSMILIVLAGIFLYKEVINLKYVIGLLFGVISIILIAK